MANDIVRFDGDDGIEVLIDTTTGESFASVRGYARMSGKNASTISRRLKGDAFGVTKIAEVETEGGIQGVALIPEDLICEWLPKDNPDAAKLLLKLGVRSMLHKIAGYEVKSTAVAQPLSVMDMIIASAQAHKALEARQEATEKLLREVIAQKDEEIRLLRDSIEVVEMETQANAAELDRFRNGHGYFFSIAGWCSKNGYELDLKKMSNMGRKATAMCKTYGIQPVPVNDPRWGTVGTYPDKILMELNWD